MSAVSTAAFFRRVVEQDRLAGGLLFGLPADPCETCRGEGGHEIVTDGEVVALVPCVACNGTGDRMVADMAGRS